MDGVAPTQGSEERSTSRSVVPRDRGLPDRAIREQRLDYVPREDATPDAEIRALVEAYRFLLDRSREQPTTTTTHRDADSTGREGDRG